MEQADHAAHTSPLDAAANGHLGMVLHAHDRYGAAEVAYRRAAILDQRSARWLYYLGVVQAEQAKNADAEASYRQALDRDPGNVPVRLRLAEALWGSGNLPQSAVEYRAILATQPGNALAHHGLGRVLAAQGQWADAVASYRRAIDLYPRFGAAHHAVSQAYQHLGDETSAARHRLLSDVNSSGEPVRDDPWMSAVFALNRSRTYFVKRAAELASAGLLTDAAAAYERSIELEPKDPLVAQVRTRLIGVYTDLGEWNQVEMNYHAALELDPRQADAHFFYGVACVRRGRIDEAAQAFVQALQIDPTHAWAHNQLGRLLEQRGQVAEAERHYRQAIASDPQHRMALFNIGHLLAERREYGAAISYLVRTLTPEDLNTPRYAHYLATIYERAGQRDRAITSARAAKAMAVTFGRGDLVATLDSYLTRLGDMAPAAARGSRVAAPEAVSAGAGDHGAGGRGAIE
ncbi:MAG: tetratricopeptide repeat protein [Acidobacteria bacterium]|nr:tetratricopeptide repeat protein [Acidobacteriota bacterium]